MWHKEMCSVAQRHKDAGILVEQCRSSKLYCGETGISEPWFISLYLSSTEIELFPAKALTCSCSGRKNEYSHWGTLSEDKNNTLVLF